MKDAKYRDRLQNYKPEDSHAKKIIKWCKTNPELSAQVIVKKCLPLTSLVVILWALNDFFIAEGKCADYFAGALKSSGPTVI